MKQRLTFVLLLVAVAVAVAVATTTPYHDYGGGGDDDDSFLSASGWFDSKPKKTTTTKTETAVKQTLQPSKPAAGAVSGGGGAAVQIDVASIGASHRKTVEGFSFCPAAGNGVENKLKYFAKVAACSHFVRDEKVFKWGINAPTYHMVRACEGFVGQVAIRVDKLKCKNNLKEFEKLLKGVTANDRDDRATFASSKSAAAWKLSADAKCLTGGAYYFSTDYPDSREIKLFDDASTKSLADVVKKYPCKF